MICCSTLNLTSHNSQRTERERGRGRDEEKRARAHGKEKEAMEYIENDREREREKERGGVEARRDRQQREKQRERRSLFDIPPPLSPCLEVASILSNSIEYSASDEGERHPELEGGRVECVPKKKKDNLNKKWTNSKSREVWCFLIGWA